MSRANRKNRYSTTPESLYNKLVGLGTFVCYFEYFAIYSLYRECLCY